MGRAKTSGSGVNSEVLNPADINIWKLLRNHTLHLLSGHFASAFPFWPTIWIMVILCTETWSEELSFDYFKKLEKTILEKDSGLHSQFFKYWHIRTPYVPVPAQTAILWLYNKLLLPRGHFLLITFFDSHGTNNFHSQSVEENLVVHNGLEQNSSMFQVKLKSLRSANNSLRRIRQGEAAEVKVNYLLLTTYSKIENSFCC